MNNLSKSQNAIYEFIKNKISQTGVAPSVREIAAAVGLRSTSSVQYNLNILEEAGLIKRDANLKRTIRLAGGAENIKHIPVIGHCYRRYSYTCHTAD